MFELTESYIKHRIADTPLIYYRGRYLYEHGSFALSESEFETGNFTYDVDGSYGDYVTRIRLQDEGVESSCDCPYPGKGCKHTVAVLLHVRDQMERFKAEPPSGAFRRTIIYRRKKSVNRPSPTGKAGPGPNISKSPRGGDAQRGFT